MPCFFCNFFQKLYENACFFPLYGIYYIQDKQRGDTPKELEMKEFEIKVFAGYISGGETYYNCFKEYVNARNATEAKRALKKELKSDGYIDIEFSDVIPC